MPHQCLKCGQVFEEGSSQLLKGCPDCGGNRFFYTKKPLNEEKRNAITDEVGKDMNSVISEIDRFIKQRERLEARKKRIAERKRIKEEIKADYTQEPFITQMKRVLGWKELETGREPAIKEEEGELYEIEKGENKGQEAIPKEVAPSAKPEKKAVEEPIEFEHHKKQKKPMKRITAQKKERLCRGTSKGSRRKGERRRPELQAKRVLKQKEDERKKAEFGGAEQKKVEIEKTDAVIKDVKIYTDTHYFVKNFDNCYEMEDLWAKRPKLYGNTNILFVTTKSSEGKEIPEIFPVLLRFDGTLEPNAANRISRMHRNRFASFLKYYKITEKIEDYNIVERMNEWKGKEVKMISHKGRNQIFIPYH